VRNPSPELSPHHAYQTRSLSLIPETLVKRAFEALRGNFCQSTSFETHIENSEAMVHGAMIRLMLKRLAA
jgi:hypothetical protein